jgi:hypothetical protein
LSISFSVLGYQMIAAISQAENKSKLFFLEDAGSNRL